MINIFISKGFGWIYSLLSIFVGKDSANRVKYKAKT